jgi:hypothetical protein
LFSTRSCLVCAGGVPRDAGEVQGGTDEAAAGGHGVHEEGGVAAQLALHLRQIAAQYPFIRYRKITASINQISPKASCLLLFSGDFLDRHPLFLFISSCRLSYWLPACMSILYLHLKEKQTKLCNLDMFLVLFLEHLLMRAYLRTASCTRVTFLWLMPQCGSIPNQGFQKILLPGLLFLAMHLRDSSTWLPSIFASVGK